MSTKSTVPRPVAILFSMALGGAALGCQPQAPSDSQAPPVSPVSPPTPYYEAALKAAAWIDSQARESNNGLSWFEPFDRSQVPPESQASMPRHLPMGHDMYGGNVGVIRFWLDAWKHTGDDAFLERARRGGEYLLTDLPEDQPSPDQRWFYSLYSGWGGVAWTLGQLHDATGDERYRQAAAGLIDHIHSLAVLEEENDQGQPIPRAHWGGTTELFYGNAGYGLLLLWAAPTLDHPPSLELARRAGNWLLEASDERPGGITWPIDKGGEKVMPNFSHGTAGVAYFLASLFEATGERTYLDAAVSAAEHLVDIADKGVDGNYCLIFHVEGTGEDRHYLSYCHGPVGSTRLFQRLHQVTGEERWREWLDRGTRGILESGIPEQETSGYWNNVSQCCGSAGVIEHMVAQYRRTGESSYLDFARRVADDMVVRATEEDGGLKWIQAEHRVRPEQLEAQVGFMQGAAGIATALFRLDAALRGIDSDRLAFIDDPWP